MSEHDTSGNAFPYQDKNADGTHYHSNAGMSLRDYFAAQAITGLLSSEREGYAYGDRALAAREAYSVADAMLAERGLPPAVHSPKP